jgi:hypothetical protein
VVDLVGTCPKDEWLEWLAEGDCAGDSPLWQEYGWYTHHWRRNMISPGNRFYVVAWGRLRGWAPVTRIHRQEDGTPIAIIRSGNAVACTIAEPIKGFRGLLHPWWRREDEVPFPDWKTAGVGIEAGTARPAGKKAHT